MIKEEIRFEDSNIMEGMVSFRAVIDSMTKKPQGYDRRINKLYFDSSKVKKLASHLSYIKAMSYKFGFEICPVSSQTIDGMTIGSSHGGIVFECTQRSIPSLDSYPLRDNGFAVILDGVEDPYNFGFAARSLYAAGVDLLLLPERNWMSAAGVVCRSSAGASELMDMAIFDPATFSDILHQKDYKIVCAELENSSSCYECDLSKPVCLVIGGERRGISSVIKSQCDSFVRIEYGRDFPAALSATGAATVLAFEVLRQSKK